MKSLVTALFIMFVTVLSLFGAYLTDIPQEIMQPDGTVINCFASGDEYHNWLHDADNFTIIQDKLTGYYTYAQKSGMDLTSSQYIVGKVNPRTINLAPGLNISTVQYQQKRNQWWQGTPRNVRAPTSGLINNIVVFIRFSDQTEFTAPFSTYNTMFNSTVPNTNSMYNYFMEDSYQMLSIVTAFYPIPENHLVVSFQDSLPRNYYMPYSASNPIGYNDSTERREREHTLLVNAIQYIAPQVPPTLVIDSDNDGQVDNVCFVVKGSSGAWADLLWPHKWSLYTYEVYLNNARVFTYNFQLENSLSSSGVGVLCHEMSHSIGMPDLYHYTSNGITPIGRWDLMESNRNPPQHHTAFMKSRYTDWLPPMRQITQSGTYWVNKMRIQQNNCYKIASNNPQYYYVVEFRKQEGFFEPSIPGTGLLVYRVDTSADGQGNASGPPDELYVYRPGGTLTSNGTINSAHFSSQVNRTAINESTNPSPFLADGQQGGLNITQIGSSAGDSISFYLSMPPVPPTDYDEGFESGDFLAYDWTMNGNAGWIINNANAYQGSFCAKSDSIGHNQSVSMTLAVDVPANGHIGFYKKVSSELSYDYLKFYIDNMQKGQWSGNSNWSYVQYPITQGQHNLKWSYIKDQGVVSGMDCAWVDNVLFRWEDDFLLTPPINFEAVSLSDDVGIYLNWQRPLQTSAALNGYRIFRDNMQIADIDTSDTFYYDYNVMPNRTYLYYLKSFYVSPNGHSSASDTISVIVTGTPIIPILTITEVVDTNSVYIQWTLPVSDRGINGYHIYRNGALVHTIDDASIMQWTDEELDYGIYLYQVASRYPVFTSDLSDPLLVIIEEIVTNNDLLDTPLVFGIQNIFPNPSKHQVNIQFCNDKDNAWIELSVYNIKGQKVKTLINGQTKSGYQKIIWNNVDDNSHSISTGVYFIRLKSATTSNTKKVLLIR